MTTLPLFAWLSPTFPVGAYAYSHGLEWAVEDGDVRDEASLLDWLRDTLTHGAGRNDAIFLAATHRALAFGDLTKINEINELALAFAPSQELRLETAQQGRSFLDAVLAAWPHDSLTDAAKGIDEIAYPVAVGLAASAHGIARQATLPAFLLAFAQNLVSAAIRSAPIGQTTGMRVLSALTPLVTELAGTAENLSLDDVGSAVFRADLGSFRHETQYTRLFRS
ncbi:urease accessory protein UreF [Flaviflagellibacter deserti]|uniref:Urease accessory protein UreF n=1 Tax=Flaviflagellibacter deserti TaxID=2267266 RepID=A0ABV9Z2Z1_9HYPH